LIYFRLVLVFGENQRFTVGIFYMPTKYVPLGTPRGRPVHVPTDDTRRRVLQAAAFGVRHDGICRLIGVALPTLQKYYADELARAGDVLVEEIAGAMYTKALGGDIGAQKYILGCRAGWSEKQTIEHTGRIERIERIFIDGPAEARLIEAEFDVVDG
jgi:hypothetical protein